MKLLTFLFTLALGVCLSGATSLAAEPEIAPQLYQQVRKAVFQVRVLEKASGNKASTGSGFPVGSGGLIATNYHVISRVVEKNKKYRAQLIDHADRVFEAKVVAVDVVHDLALLAAEGIQTSPLPIAAEEPKQGTTIYALGYPYDVGITLVPGTHNGMIDHSAYGRIHFSGALNPGMSGGPAVDGTGNIIGVNVSTAGNSLSFLVPAKALDAFLGRPLPAGRTELVAGIGDQLRKNGARLIREVIDGNWEAEPIGGGTALGEFTNYIRCWGTSNTDEEDERHLRVARHCRIDDQIYLSPTLRTGRIGLEYFWIEAKELNRWQFYTYYDKLFSNFRSDNRTGEKDVGNYECRTSFIADKAADRATIKAVYCVRAYRKFEDFFDVLYSHGSIDHNERAHVAHYTLAGVPRAAALEFHEKFMGSQAWSSLK